MATNSIYKSDLNQLYGLVQSSMIVYPKEIIIQHLRDFFSKDSLYHYVKDEWGFSKKVDHTDLPLGAGLFDNLATRVHISESHPHDGIFYPFVMVRHSSARYVPISINREAGKFETTPRIFEDGYGNQTVFQNPSKFIFEGVFEGQLSIEIAARSPRTRDDIAELIAMYLTDIGFDHLYHSGLVIKPISIGSPSEVQDRNEYVYKNTISIDYRMEWRREVPISNIIEAILFTIVFQNLDDPNAAPASNLTINTSNSLSDIILDI
jgi:hypothetical protein